MPAMDSLEKTALSLGFIPLTDCAPLVVAREKGFFSQYGLEVTLSKETSWANIRDKVALGILDGAQMLAPMPLSISLGLGPIHKPMITAFVLGLNGNAITVSTALYARMLQADVRAMAARPLAADALREVIAADKAAGRPPLTFAMVFPESTHNYELRYWLAAVGIDPEHDVRLVVVPPAQMVSQLEQGQIDGYCVGEPWNAQAVQRGLGHTLITSYEIWNNRPEKVLGVTQEWAAQHPNTHLALLMALLEASRWLDEPCNRIEAATIISRSIYVNAPDHIVRMSLSGNFQYTANAMPRTLPDFNVFYRYAANFPWRSSAMWFITQMLRWGQLGQAVDIRACAEAVYRPDLFRQAAATLGVSTPGIDYKMEGRHRESWKMHEPSGSHLMGSDSFIDRNVFDPARPIDYLHGFSVHNLSVDTQLLAALNQHHNATDNRAHPFAQECSQ